MTVNRENRGTGSLRPLNATGQSVIVVALLLAIKKDKVTLHAHMLTCFISGKFSQVWDCRAVASLMQTDVLKCSDKGSKTGALLKCE